MVRLLLLYVYNEQNWNLLLTTILGSGGCSHVMFADGGLVSGQELVS